jgi:hypothetical protein
VAFIAHHLFPLQEDRVQSRVSLVLFDSSSQGLDDVRGRILGLRKGRGQEGCIIRETWNLTIYTNASGMNGLAWHPGIRGLTARDVECHPKHFPLLSRTSEQDAVPPCKCFTSLRCKALAVLSTPARRPQRTDWENFPVLVTHQILGGKGCEKLCFTTRGLAKL